MTRGCVGCHDAPLGRVDHSVVPLAGDLGQFQSALLEFRSGDRDHRVMNQVARGLNDDEIGHLSAFLASRSLR